MNINTEEMLRAGVLMRDAAEQMTRAVSQLDTLLDRHRAVQEEMIQRVENMHTFHQGFMDGWLVRVIGLMETFTNALDRTVYPPPPPAG